MKPDRAILLIITIICIGSLFVWGIRNWSSKHGWETRRAIVHKKTHIPAHWKHYMREKCETCTRMGFDMDMNPRLEYYDCNCKDVPDSTWIKDKYFMTKRYIDREHVTQYRKKQVLYEEYMTWNENDYTTIRVIY